MKDFNRGEWKDKISVLDRLLCLQGGECIGKGPDSRQRDELEAIAVIQMVSRIKQ